MARRFSIGLVAALLGCSALGVASAPAATSFGSDCVAEGSGEVGYTAFQRTSGSGTMPIVAPVSGVITKWQVNLVQGSPYVLQQRLKVLRPTGAPQTFTVVGESAIGAVGGGANVFPTRLAVSAGDQLGFDGDSGQVFGALLCLTNHSGDRTGYLLGGSVGAVLSSQSETEESTLAGFATIEPDTDNDGYGDETQDLCPHSAATHEGCPPIALDLKAGAKGANAITVIVSSDIPAAVLVKGVARLGKGRKANLKAGPKTVLPGRAVSFRLKFNKALKGKLGAMAPGKKLTLRITAEAANVAGQRSVDTLKAKLKGQG